MTPYPVQCYNNNGEPYGRYVNPYDSELRAYEWQKFEDFSVCNTFPFPSGTIGKRYERDEVVVEYHMKENGFWYIMGYGEKMKNRMPEREWKVCFRLIAQPVEKEPETSEPLISSRQYIEQVYGTSTFARSIECKDAESLLDMMDDFMDWAMQKKQEASK